MTPEKAMRQLKALIEIWNLHAPYPIYDECGHDHEYNEDGTLPEGIKDIDPIGLVCESGGWRYNICEHCCTREGFGQTEDCAADHRHGFGISRCQTIGILENDDGDYLGYRKRYLAGWPTGNTPAGWES